MSSQELFLTALAYEEKIRDLYRRAEGIVDDDRGKAIFRALGDDEQSHIAFLRYSLEQLQRDGAIEIDRLESSIPDTERINAEINHLKSKIPKQMLGDVKIVLESALKLEKETSAFYRQASVQTEGSIRKIFEKFLVIEDRHVDVVQIELDHASHNGVWFDFMEIDLEAE